MKHTTPVSLIAGDGIGPEVVVAARRVLEAVEAPITWEEVDAGASVFRRGIASGVPAETIESIARTRLVLKGPLETPVGYGEKSANVTLRKLFETYGNIRPIRELAGVPTPFAGRGVDLVVVRENVEDLYAGIEHQQTPDVAQCLKLISRPGCERIVRLAFEFARSEGRTEVVCATKANIMKLTEGLFKRVFEELSAEYPEIVAEHLIIDNVAHQMAKDPAQFDIIVTTNLNGDIISDLASGLVGGLGFAPSGNYGDDVAIFEAVHGSAPKYAGKDVINPTALILSSLMMLRHLHESDAADRIEDAVLVTLEEGHSVTQDLARQTGGDVERAASTTGFTDAIIANLGRQPTTVPPRHGSERPSGEARPRPRWTYGPERYAAIVQELVGADIFIESDDLPSVMGPMLEPLAGDAFRLLFISSRGTVAYPGASTASDHVRHFRCRFVAAHEGGAVTDADIRALLGRVAAAYPSWNHVEKLRRYAGEDGFTKAQGQ